MTVADLLARISSHELTEWMAHDELTAREREHEASRSAMKQSFKKF